EPPSAAEGAEEPSPYNAPLGPPVTAIEIRSDVPVEGEEREELLRLLDIAIGEPLNAGRIRRTLRNIQASGIAAEVELYTREEAAATGASGLPGTVAIVVLRPIVRVEEVRLSGELGLSAAELRRAVPQAEGEPLSDEGLLTGVYNLQDLYEANGYFRRSVQLLVQVDEARQRATVVYEIDSGPQARVSEIVFDGAIAPFTAAALQEQLRLREEDPYRARPAEEAAERLQRWLIGQGHGLAVVEAPEEEHDAAANTVRLTYPVEVGPKIEVVVQGAELDRLRRNGLLPFLGEAGYDEALVLQAVSRIRNYYQRQGHYKVEVESREERQDGVLRLFLTIDPGAQYTVQEIAFEGNSTFSGDTLAELMATGRRSLLRPGSGRLVTAELDQDLENIRSYYALQGFAQAEVGPARILEEGTDLRIAIPIVEGPRQLVGTITLEGDEQVKEEALRQALERRGLRDGGPFHPVLLDRGLVGLREEYRSKGYVQANLSARTDWNEDRSRVNLTFDIIEGPQQVIANIIVRGNRRTQGDVIRRTIGLRPGEPVSQGQLLAAESQLYRLGIFSRVDVELTRVGFFFDQRDVLIRVEEGRPRRLVYGVGYEYEDGSGNSGPRGLLGFSHNNVAGRAYSLQSDLRVSLRLDGEPSAERLAGRFRLLFNQPYLGQYPVSLTSLLFAERETKGRETYRVERYGTRVEAARSFGNRRVSLGLDYREVKVSNLAQVKEREDFPYQLMSVVPSFFWDRRNDPIAPVRGWSSLLQFQYAFPALDTEAEFLKIFGQQTQYLDLGGAGVVAASLRFGGIEPLRELGEEDPILRGTGLPSSNVFIDERFFAGGSATHRGYRLDQLGIRCQTLFAPQCRNPAASGDFQPVGGNGLLLLNLEYQFPLFGSFGGLVFYDTGNVWADWRDIDPAGFKQGAGLGGRWLSPVGPLSAGVGWPLDLEPGEEQNAVFFFNFGTSF
ncbi:MAG TPA: POTRA domain-containing protein, partial [Thermoanaerobaculia bacterium]|nr:POTRA domain-containing protein [Thermoanaerobaculia bacterium]